MSRPVLECVVNISEGRDAGRIGAIAEAGGSLVLDVHSDPDHHRSVLTLCGAPGPVEEAVRSVARVTVSVVDLRAHTGVHPRLGAVDVVPWVSLEGWPLGPGDPSAAIAARQEFARWAGHHMDLPCFLYGPERSLPELRREAWKSLEPDFGPSQPHPTAGATAVGARGVLVAYNLWLADPDLGLARQVAAELRGPDLRTLGLRVGAEVQVSCNLLRPERLGPGQVFDLVAGRAPVSRAELVGLLPDGILRAQPRHRWKELGIDESVTIEARLEQAGLDGGRF